MGVAGITPQTMGDMDCPGCGSHGPGCQVQPTADCCAVASAAGDDAYRKIRAGASLVEVYTAFAYEGPVLIPVIKQQLAECLARDGFSSVSEAVGADHRLQQGKLTRRNSWLGG